MSGKPGGIDLGQGIEAAGSPIVSVQDAQTRLIKIVQKIPSDVYSEDKNDVVMRIAGLESVSEIKKEANEIWGNLYQWEDENGPRSDVQPALLALPDFILEVDEYLVLESKKGKETAIPVLAGEVGVETGDPIGGIDLGDAASALEIRRDGNGIVLPLNQQSMEFQNIEGFHY
jgi:hypothetical protein